MKPFPKIKELAVLSPMARITDVAFRSICRKYGTGLTVTELLNAKGLIQNPDRVDIDCQRAPNEDHFSVQLFGHDPKDMVEAGAMAQKHCHIIDINLGCPAYKICRVGAGSQLMAEPDHVKNIVSQMVDALNVPITVKMRTGLNDNMITVHEVTKACEDAGAAMVMVHGRTRDQMYSGHANWDLIKEVKKRMSIPVIGNGDISKPEHVKERIEETNVDYVSIGRAASGNPLLFKQINDYMKTGEYNEQTTQDKLRVFKEYIELSRKYNTSFLHQKIQSQHFTKGIVGAAKLRLALNDARDTDALLQTISEFLE